MHPIGFNGYAYLHLFDRYLFRQSLQDKLQSLNLGFKLFGFIGYQIAAWRVDPWCLTFMQIMRPGHFRAGPFPDKNIYINPYGRNRVQ